LRKPALVDHDHHDRHRHVRDDLRQRLEEGLARFLAERRKRGRS
jgi:hypothetical protein